MTDIYSREKRSEIMSLVRSRGTKPEIALRKLVSAHFYPHGYRYRLHCRQLPGTPDLVFHKQKVVIFVDGGFWHGYKFDRWRHKLDTQFWLPKIEANMERDKRVNRELKATGWKVIRIWENELAKQPDRVIEKITAAFRSNSHSNRIRRKTQRR